MAKRVEKRPDWLGASGVEEIHSVSSCISEDFADYINFWQHNGYWLFDSPDAVRRLAEEKRIDLEGTELFYCEAYEHEFDEEAGSWDSFSSEPSFMLDVKKPTKARLEGFDVVSFSAGNAPECSPLSCNGLAEEIETNRLCLLPSFEAAKGLLENGAFTRCEPGPYRIFAVHSVDWP